MNSNVLMCSLGACLLGLAACSDAPRSYIVDGPRGPAFQSDLAACQQLSRQKMEENTGTVTGAVIGGLAGAADAGSGDALEGAVVGGVIGGLFGKAEDKAVVEEARESIVFECLKGRGHKVVG